MGHHVSRACEEDSKQRIASDTHMQNHLECMLHYCIFQSEIMIKHSSHIVHLVDTDDLEMNRFFVTVIEIYCGSVCLDVYVHTCVCRCMHAYM